MWGNPTGRGSSPRPDFHRPFSERGNLLGMPSRTPIFVLTAIACAIVIAAAIAGVVTFRELAAVSTNLDRMSANMDVVAANIEQVSKEMGALRKIDQQLSAMNGKLSKTNSLLLKTNASLGTMVGQARASDAKLARMEADLSVMSHKISGSFLFRGVK
jgi:septal ring factor EnvC (AmiA/AmiB activator)